MPRQLRLAPRPSNMRFGLSHADGPNDGRRRHEGREEEEIEDDAPLSFSSLSFPTPLYLSYGFIASLACGDGLNESFFLHKSSLSASPLESLLLAYLLRRSLLLARYSNFPTMFDACCVGRYFGGQNTVSDCVRIALPRS